MARTTPCPEPPLLRQLLLGQVPAPQAEALEEHLAHCRVCGRVLPGLQADDPLVEAMRDNRSVPLAKGEVNLVSGLIQSLKGLRATDSTISQAAGPNPTSDSAFDQPTQAGNFDFLDPAQGPGELGRLGSYRVLGLLGSGGMGLVFLAEDIRLKRPVALKVIKPALVVNPQVRPRFLREAQATAAIEHENIIAIYQVDEHAGIPYLAMPLLRGETLEERLRREQILPLDEVLRIGRQIAEGLAAAHERGLIHRDIKPSNIFLADVGPPRLGGSDGAARLAAPTVKIVDFGLARSREDDDRQLTKPGLILGTPAYMSPEQARSEKADQRSDLFSLGCVLYRLGTGQLPFCGKDTIALLLSIALDTPKPPREVNPDVPAALSDLVDRLLAKDPASRPQSAREVAEALVTIEGQRASAAKPARRRWPWFVAGITAAALLGVFGFASFLAVPRTENGELVLESDDTGGKLTIAQGDKTIAVLDLKPKQNISLPPGTYQLSLSGARAGLRLYPEAVVLDRGVRQVVKACLVGEIRRFEGHTGRVWSVALSADGRTALSGGGGDYRDGKFVANIDLTVRVWDVASGKERHGLKGSTGVVRCVALTPDGSRGLSGGDDQAVRVWDLIAGTELHLFREHAAPVWTVAVAPDTQMALSGDRDGKLLLWDIATGKLVRPLVGPKGGVKSAVFSPDGKRVLSGSHDHTVRLWDVAAGRQEWLLEEHTDRVQCVAFAPDGKRALSGGHDHTVRVWEVATGKELFCFDKHKEVVQSVAFAPDGRRALSSGSKTVYLWDVETGKVLQPFEGHTSPVSCVVFTPDGQHALSSSWDHSVRLWGLPLE